MKGIWIDGGLFVTMRDEQPVLRGHLIMKGDRIVSIREEAPLPEQQEGLTRVSGSGLVFMPGLINTHGHSPMSLLRGFSDDEALQVWLQDKMWPMEARYKAQDTRVGASLAILEMLKSGTTTFVDMYDRMDAVAEVAEQGGIRAWLTRGVIGLCPEEEQRQKLEEALDFALRWNGQADGRIHTLLSPHAPYTCPPAYIEQIVQAAHDHNLPLHTHMSETLAEVEQNVRDYGCRPVAHLERLGFFSRPSFVAHAVHLTDEEISLLAERKVAVSHNPASNLKLASGVARVPQLLSAGVTVSLGTDSAASNNQLDLFGEVRLAALIHKGVSGDPTKIPAWTALQLATVHGARTLWREGELGVLQAGAKADLIALDVEQPHFYPQSDMVSHLVYAGSGRDVRHVWVDGHQVVRDRICTELDEERIRSEANSSLARLRQG